MMGSFGAVPLQTLKKITSTLSAWKRMVNNHNEPSNNQTLALTANHQALILWSVVLL